jgi:MinD-like ATPase involved in chromosome partitioning or flagellar assembly
VVTFDQALPALVRVCERAPGFTALKTACAVRDLRGRLRLVVEPDPGRPPVDLSALQNELQQELAGYFVAPIWSTGPQRVDEARLAGALLQQAKLWVDPSFEDLGTGARVVSAARWKKLERRLSKQEWLESTGGGPPWELEQGKPGIVTFYSFKGGVGRTTALAACAWQLARAQKKVVVIDLDLEAPGLSALFEAEAERGVADFLVDHLATGSTDIEGIVVERAAALGADGDRVSVIGAGRLDASYLEKLARLDFISEGPASGPGGDVSPIERALRDLLFAVLGKYRPDYILLDSRAGLHDLAGLSLHRLAHVDVLVGRATEQGYRGLDLTLGVLAKRKGTDKLQCVVAHTFAPTEGNREAVIEEEEFRARSYEMFCKNVYGQKAATIAASDEGLHVPIVIRRDIRLERFSSVSPIADAFFAPWYAALREEIEELCTPGAEDE